MLKTKLADGRFAVVSFSLNVPGYPKSNRLLKTFFRQVSEELMVYLQAHRIRVENEFTMATADEAGDFLFLAVSTTDTQVLKMRCEQFEREHHLGRFLDVDVNDPFGNTLSSGLEKCCFFCREKSAVECRRTHAHTLEQLRDFLFEKTEAYVKEVRRKRLGRQLAALALQAILREISLGNKPGLVGPDDQGSHHDMNYQTFLASTSSIAVWFEELAAMGLRYPSENPADALPELRRIGLQMESAMFAATGGVNTQKGIIFLLGLSLFATGLHYQKASVFQEESIRSILRKICTGLVHQELEVSSGSNSSHGETVFQRFGAPGARGEAEAGLPLVFEWGLPILKAMGPSDPGLLKCLFTMAARNEDTNILYRKGPSVLANFQMHCLQASVDFTEGHCNQVAEYCRQEQISPGGSADLLALAVFFHSLEGLGTITSFD
ncbi:MAG: triphosphoribosyl-dephospho-CoA synthase [Marinilabiliales bacterium]|nr:triphosphoribosyl-dephospho-CoA synthase [Marinilabiliales bacterium]